MCRVSAESTSSSRVRPSSPRAPHGLGPCQVSPRGPGYSLGPYSADARSPCPRGSHRLGLKAKAGPSGLLWPKAAGLSENTLPLQARWWPSTQTWMNQGLDRPRQRDNASEFEDCWMCFSASLPFYEGIALFGNFTLLSDARQLPFESVQLTLTELSGIGSCVLGPAMLPPGPLLEICNNTFRVNKNGFQRDFIKVKI